MENHSLANLNKAATNNGLIIGIISCVITLLTYYGAPSMLGSMGFGFAVMAVMLLVYIYFTIDLRKKVGGFWTFKEALKGIFLMSVVSTVLASIFNFIFYKFIEPGAYDKISGSISEGLRGTYESLGMPEDQIDGAIEKALEGIKSQYNPTAMDMLKNFAIALLIGFILSLIFAAIFKKNPPAFQAQADDNN